MLKTIILVISLQGQGLNGPQALDVRNAIEDQIEAHTESEVVGAGGNVDGSEIDLQIETQDVEKTSEFIRNLMVHAELDGQYKLEIK